MTSIPTHGFDVLMLKGDDCLLAWLTTGAGMPASAYSLMIYGDDHDTANSFLTSWMYTPLSGETIFASEATGVLQDVKATLFDLFLWISNKIQFSRFSKITGKYSLIDISPIKDNAGYALTRGRARVDVFPPSARLKKGILSIRGSELTSRQTCEYTALRLAAIDFLEGFKRSKP